MMRTVGTSEVEDGRCVRLAGAFQDVTVRATLERELAESHELLQVTLQSIGDAVITADASGVVRWLNPAAEELTGWSTLDATGRPIDVGVRGGPRGDRRAVDRIDPRLPPPTRRRRVWRRRAPVAARRSAQRRGQRLADARGGRVVDRRCARVPRRVGTAPPHPRDDLPGTARPADRASPTGPSSNTTWMRGSRRRRRRESHPRTPVPRPRPVQGGERLVRPPRGRRPAPAGVDDAAHLHPRRRPGGPTRR